jgi:serine/threonine-protein kinase
MSYGPYELLARVNEGGMGEIFRARGPVPSGGRGELAIKRTRAQLANDPTFAGMFLDEARLAGHLRHPNVCQLYDSGTLAGRQYIAMEWVDGVSLRELLDRAQGGLPIPFVVSIFAEVAAALHYAHTLCDSHGEPLHIVHRDVSPANLMLGHDGTVKLLDFGLAKARTQMHRTVTGMVKGKFGYLAPEQVDESGFDGRTDVFALGLCLAEALTGQRVFDHIEPADSVRAIAHYDTPPPLVARRPEIGVALEQVVQKALARRREDRFQTARALEEALRALFRDAPSPPDRARVLRAIMGNADQPADPREATIRPEANERRGLLRVGAVVAFVCGVSALIGWVAS